MERETEAFMRAVEDLDGALDDSMEMTRRMKRRIGELRAARRAGRPLRDALPGEAQPLLARLLADVANLLQSHGTRVRRSEARALRHEGLTMDEIARLLGVSRQRVSALLREAGSRAGPRAQRRRQ